MSLGFRLLTQVNYGIGVAFLTGMLVLLLSFEGVAPGEAIGARLQATVAGSAWALIAYAVWPTRERRHIRASLAQLLSAYRDHLRNLLLGRMEDLGDTRAAARVARTNAQASIERLRGEPRSRRNLHELKLAESLLANGNRLIRATLSLEAVLRDGHPLPALEALPAFAQQADQALSELIACLVDGGIPAPATLRGAERQLSDALAALPDGSPATAALADTIDRITDSIGTLTHLLRPARPASTTAAAEAAAAHDGAHGAGG